MKKQVKYISAGMLAGMLLCGGQMQAANTMSGMHVCVTVSYTHLTLPTILLV